MRLRTWLRGALLLTVVVLGPGRDLRAESPPVRAELRCRPEAAPGRVLCELTYRASEGTRLVWADALVTDAPPFAPPLRARVSPVRFAEASSADRKLNLAFVAGRAGVGTVSVRARAVACRGRAEQERCQAYTELVQAELRVGN